MIGDLCFAVVVVCICIRPSNERPTPSPLTIIVCGWKNVFCVVTWENVDERIILNQKESWACQTQPKNDKFYNDIGERIQNVEKMTNDEVMSRELLFAAKPRFSNANNRRIKALPR